MSKMGRPTKYDPAMDEAVLELGRQGKSRIAIAAMIGIGRATLYRWLEEDENFRDIVAEAMVYSQLWWEDKGQASLDSQGFQSALYNKQMAGRFHEDWRDTKPPEKPDETPSGEALNMALKMLMAKYEGK